MPTIAYNLLQNMEKPKLYGEVKKLTSLAKNTLTEGQSALEDLACSFRLGRTAPVSTLAEITQEVLNLCWADVSKYDFDDMCAFVHRFDLRCNDFDVIIADESQDLNNLQMWIIRNSLLKPDGRFIHVGDPKQAIYGWRGSDSEAFERLTKEFNSKVLNLSITFRCPRKIVQFVKQEGLIENYEAFEGNPEGEIHEIDYSQIFDNAEGGDYILSRTNAPLAKICLQLLRQGKRANIAGLDIGSSLNSFIKEARCESVPDLMIWIENYRQAEHERLTANPAQDNSSALDYMNDKLDTIRVLSEGCSTTKQVSQKIRNIFIDEDDRRKKVDPSKVILCSTIHKAKGRERNRVFALEATMNNSSQEERNIKYVAYTRTKHSLFLLDGLPERN